MRADFNRSCPCERIRADGNSFRQIFLRFRVASYGVTKSVIIFASLLAISERKECLLRSCAQIDLRIISNGDTHALRAGIDRIHAILDKCPLALYDIIGGCSLRRQRRTRTKQKGADRSKEKAYLFPQTSAASGNTCIKTTLRNHSTSPRRSTNDTFPN